MYLFFIRTSFWQLFSSYMYVEKAAKTTFIRKICVYKVDEIDTCSNANVDEIDPTSEINQLSWKIGETFFHPLPRKERALNYRTKRETEPKQICFLPPTHMFWGIISVKFLNSSFRKKQEFLISVQFFFFRMWNYVKKKFFSKFFQTLA